MSVEDERFSALLFRAAVDEDMYPYNPWYALIFVAEDPGSNPARHLPTRYDERAAEQR